MAQMIGKAPFHAVKTACARYDCGDKVGFLHANLAVAHTVRHALAGGRDFAVLFVALGAVGAASEFRHGTAIPTFLAQALADRPLTVLVLEMGYGDCEYALVRLARGHCCAASG